MPRRDFSKPNHSKPNHSEPEHSKPDHSQAPPPVYSAAQPSTTPSSNGMSTNQTCVNMSTTSRDKDGTTNVGRDFEERIGFSLQLNANPGNSDAQLEAVQMLKSLFERGSGVDISATSEDTNHKKTVKESYDRKVGPNFSF